MAVTNWDTFIQQTDSRIGEVRKGAPDMAKAFQGLAKASTAPGALDTKTKELIALAIGITARCDGCLAYHTRAAAKHGATREEIIEVISVSVYMGGGPSMIYGAEALAAYDGLSKS
jgi:AhpD family alkylhydroperoxidase